MAQGSIRVDITQMDAVKELIGASFEIRAARHSGRNLDSNLDRLEAALLVLEAFATPPQVEEAAALQRWSIRDTHWLEIGTAFFDPSLDSVQVRNILIGKEGYSSDIAVLKA